MAKAKSSRSPLADPASRIHQLARDVQPYLYLPDPSPLYVALGTLAANMMSGVPVWVMLIGSASAGKTECIEALDGIDKVEVISAIKTPASLVSGTPLRDKSKDATGGLLQHMGQRGMICPFDFTSMLSLPNKDLVEMLSILRDVSDGRYRRELGTDGGKTIVWRGSVGFLGAVTPEIEYYHTTIAKMGQRWIFYRFPQSLDGGHGASRKSLEREDREVVHIKIRELVREFVKDIGLEWSCWGACDEEHTHIEVPRRELTEAEMRRIIGMGSITARARSVIPRDHYPPYVIVGIGEAEEPPRINTALSQLYLGFEAIGLEEEERWRLLGKMSADSAPKLRTAVLFAVAGMDLEVGDTGMGMAELYKAIGVSGGTLTRCIEDLQYYGLLRKEKNSQERVRLTEYAKREIRRGWLGG